jgi:hypothetical protein
MYLGKKFLVSAWIVTQESQEPEAAIANRSPSVAGGKSKDWRRHLGVKPPTPVPSQFLQGLERGKRSP